MPILSRQKAGVPSDATMSLSPLCPALRPPQGARQPTRGRYAGSRDIRCRGYPSRRSNAMASWLYLCITPAPTKKPAGNRQAGLLARNDWLLLVVLFPRRFLRTLFRSLLGALLGALFGHLLACLAGFHRRAFDDGAWLNHRGDLFDFSDHSRHDRGRDHRALAAARHRGYPGRQSQIRNVDRLSDRERRKIDLDERRQILGQARDLELRS